MLNNKFKKILEDIDFIEEWEDKYRYIIDLGKKLDNFDEVNKNDFNKVNGCASQVWISYEKKIKDKKEFILFS